MMDLNTASSVLSALAEHFVDARRGRDVLDELSSVTLRWLMEKQGKSASNSQLSQTVTTPKGNSDPHTYGHEKGGQHSTIEADMTQFNSEESLPSQPFDDFFTSESWESLFGVPNDPELPFQIDTIMQGVFNDFQPDFDFGESLALDNNMLTGDPIL